MVAMVAAEDHPKANYDNDYRPHVFPHNIDVKIFLGQKHAADQDENDAARFPEIVFKPDK